MAALASCGVVLYVSGCGGGGYSPPPPPPPVVNVSVSPNFGAMDQGQSVTFTATTNDTLGKGVNWTMSGPGTLTGTNSGSTTYNAPSSVPGPTQVTLTATSVTNPADFFAVGFNVVPPPMIMTSPGMPPGNIGTAYNNRIPVMNGTGNFTFAKTGGTLPQGLTMDNLGNVSGTPTGTPQTYNFTVTVTDASPGGAVTSPPANLSINIGPPLPLTITTPTAPAGTVGFPYHFFISATGGVQPYNFSLAPASSALPAGLNLTTDTFTNQGVISGTPTVAGTTPNIMVQVTDSQPKVSPAAIYNITINPSTSFIGTQAPGDIWQIYFVHSNATDGMFNETDRGTNGLPSTTGSAKVKSFSTPPAGFRKYLDGFHCIFPRRCPPVFGYVVEMQDEMVLMQPAGVDSKVVAAVANSCPQLPLPTPTNYQFVTLPSRNFVITDAAYGNVAVTQPVSSSNTYNLTFNTFRLDGTGHTSNTFPTVSCDSTFQVLTIPGTSPTTMAFSGRGAMVIDNGTGIPAVGLQRPAGPLSTTPILAGQYLGVLFRPNSAAGPPANALRITQMVGFGPNTTGTTLTGGIYANPDRDLFSGHPTDEVITLGTQTSPGLFTGGTLAIGTNPVIKNFDVVAGQVNGKFVLYGIGLDTSISSSPQPTAVLLIQQ
jgi:hypothetical protein